MHNSPLKIYFFKCYLLCLLVFKDEHKTMTGQMSDMFPDLTKTPAVGA